MTPDDPDRDHWHSQGDPRTFVFGSNLLGIHGAGAALYARRCLGALQLVGEGPMNGAYALPTCSAPGTPRTLEEVSASIRKFLDYAAENPDRRFFVSKVGCDLAGFSEDEIAPLFRGAPPNVDLPPSWRER